MRDWLKIFMIIVVAVAISFLITSALVWIVLWSAPALGFSVPAFSWKICVFVWVILLIIRTIFKTKNSKTE